ncbi:MAG: NUDIX hydrolase [Fusobacteriaceae bacterium]
MGRGFLERKIKNLDGGRQVLVMPNSVNFLLLTKDNYVVYGVQKRAGDMNKETPNLFGGYIDGGEDVIETAMREAFEEANVPEEIVSTVTVIYENKAVSLGYTTERNSLLFLNLKLNKDDLVDILKCNDEDENISICYATVQDFCDMEAEGLKMFVAQMELEILYGC